MAVANSQIRSEREFFGIYHYLLAKGVVGRWVHLFRAEVTEDDPTMYFQRMSGDMRGINGEAAVSIDGGRS